MKKLKCIKGIPLKYIESVVKIDSKSPSGLTWLPRKNAQFNSYCAKKMAGSKQTKTNGYQSWVIKITYNRKEYLLRCSRVILLLKNRYLTEGKEVDHIDVNSLNNKVENLRESTASENQRNCKIPKNNTSGCKGVYWIKSRSVWEVKINLHGITYRFGYFDDKEDAIKVAIAARKKLHGGFGRDE
jgi:hypothetical protein